MTVQELGHAVAEWAKGEVLVRRVYLFGSRAKATHHAASDADLAILYRIDPVVLAACDSPTVARLLTWFDWEECWRTRLQKRLPMRVHLHAVDRADAKVVWPALKERRYCLYRRDLPKHPQ